MSKIFQILIILSVLLGFGMAKRGFEQGLFEKMSEKKILHESLPASIHRKIGQTGWAVVLGGLRTHLASLWSLKAFSQFRHLDWIGLEESYKVITSLQPHNSFFWLTGAWHLHTNASVHFAQNENLSPIRRKSLEQKYIIKGAAFLQDAINQNPENWLFHYALARLWSDAYKNPDFKKSLTHYKNTLACEELPNHQRAMIRRFHFYTLCRANGREKEAYKLGRALFFQSKKNHLPTLTSCLFALQNTLKIPPQLRIQEDELFFNKKQQQKILENYWKRRALGYPMQGVKKKIEDLHSLVK